MAEQHDTDTNAADESPVLADLTSTDWPERRPVTAWTQVSRPQAALIVAACLALGAGIFVWARAAGGKQALSIESTESLEQVLRPARININKAPWHELSLLPGIGEKKAKAIVEFRKANGAFERIDDLTRVKGIGAATLEKLVQLITVKE